MVTTTPSPGAMNTQRAVTASARAEIATPKLPLCAQRAAIANVIEISPLLQRHFRCLDYLRVFGDVLANERAELLGGPADRIESEVGEALAYLAAELLVRFGIEPVDHLARRARGGEQSDPAQTLEAFEPGFVHRR